MSEDIKELVKRLRAEEWATVEREQTRNAAADALEAMAGEVERLKVHRDAVAQTCALGFSEFERVKAERDRLAGEVDTLQMKLAACGVGALANTERTVAQRITKESPHWSASLGDVYHIVDKEMEARAERDRLKAALEPFAKLSTDRERQDPPEGTMRVRVVTAPEIEAARKALGDAS